MDSEFEVTGVSRSGRVRKKSSKLMDFESPDNIDSRQSKIVTPRTVEPPNPGSSRRIVSEERESPDPDSKSENEDAFAGSSDSDYYDPALDNHDSMDSADSEDALSENSMNSAGDLSRNLSRAAAFQLDRSHKKKIPARPNPVMKNIPVYDRQNFHANSSNRQRSSSRNRHPTILRNSIQIGPNNAISGNSSSNGGMYRVVGVGPVEIGAHLHLLGESLTIIGERLKEHEGQIAVSGSVSVLLDTLLCSLAPLICLTAHIPAIAPPHELLQDTLDNIAYIMPGL